MKRIFFVIGILILSVCSVKAQKKVEKKNVDPNAAEIVFDKLVYDYGTINQYGDGNCEFNFTNTGKEPLVLTNVRSSCGCTVPKWPRRPVLPGKSSVIKVKYTTSRMGSFHKSITVYSNAKTSPIVLKIKGKVIKKPDEIMPVKKINSNATPVAK